MEMIIIQNRVLISHAYIISILHDPFPLITSFDLMIFLMSKVIMNIDDNVNNGDYDDNEDDDDGEDDMNDDEMEM
jgi:hypothetical protein